MLKGNEIAVVHLIWIPYGMQIFQNFLASYKNSNAGFPHDLIFLFNGGNSNDLKEYQDYADKFDVEYTSYSLKQGQDIEAYKWLANQVNHEYLLFLNSHSVIQDNNWLLNYVKKIEEKNAGAVGATGSLQSYYSSVFMENSYAWIRTKGFTENIRKYKLLLKAFFYWRFLFKPFPNPHLRTNAFMISRVVFLQIKLKNIRTKFEAYQFESGRNSLSAQLIKKGYDVLVIDKKGKCYKIKDWVKSSTFWKNNQENLLISDNQTRLYEMADKVKKSFLSSLAWGKYE